MSGPPIAAALEAVIREIVRQELAASRTTPAPSAAEAGREPEFLSVSEAAEVARVHPATIREWLRDGRLARFAAGKRARVKSADLRALLECRPAPEPINLAERAEAIRGKVEAPARGH